MSHDVEFRVAERQMRVRWSGPVNDVDLLKADEDLRAHPDFDSSFDQLLDFSEATSGDLSREGLLELVSRPPAFERTCRRAIIVPNDLGFGLGRMFEQMRGDEAGMILICRSLDEAERWLQGEE